MRYFERYLGVILCQIVLKWWFCDIVWLIGLADGYTLRNYWKLETYLSAYTQICVSTDPRNLQKKSCHTNIDELNQKVWKNVLHLECKKRTAFKVWKNVLHLECKKRTAFKVWKNVLHLECKKRTAFNEREIYCI